MIQTNVQEVAMIVVDLASLVLCMASHEHVPNRGQHPIMKMITICFD